MRTLVNCIRRVLGLGMRNVIEMIIGGGVGEELTDAHGVIKFNHSLGKFSGNTAEPNARVRLVTCVAGFSGCQKLNHRKFHCIGNIPRP